MQNLTVKVNPSRRTCSIAQTIYLGGKYDVTYEPDGIYQMRIVAPSSDSPSEGIVVWAETDGTGKKLELNRRVLFNEFKRQDARQPGMTIAAKVYILDASVVGGDYASGGEPIADGDITIEYVPCTDIIDPAVYESTRQMLDTAWGYKNEAKGFRDEAEGFRDEAEAFRDTAGRHAERAETLADNAAQSVIDAAAEVEKAEKARTEAQEAQGAAEQAWVGAEAAASNAEQTAAELKNSLEKIDALEKGLQAEAKDRFDGDEELWKKIEELGGGAVFLPSYEDIVALEDKKEDRIYVATQTNTLYRCVYKTYFTWEVVQIGGAGGGVEFYESWDQLPTPGKEDVIYCAIGSDVHLTKLYRWNANDREYVPITMSIDQTNSQIYQHIRALIQIVPPSADGAGKAADAKAVHDALEVKRGKTDLTVYTGDKNKPMLPPDALPVTWGDETGHRIELGSDGEYTLRTGVNGFNIAVFYPDGTLRSVDPTTRFGGKSGIDGQWPKLIFGGAVPTSGKILTSADGVSLLPRYPFVDAAIADGMVTVAPYTNAKLVSDGTAFTVAVGGESGYMRDCVLRVECGETAPTITWPTNFHPRTDAETDFACEAGKRNVYWITEYASNQFCVAGWQETEGGGTSEGGAA